MRRRCRGSRSWSGSEGAASGAASCARGCRCPRLRRAPARAIGRCARASVAAAVLLSPPQLGARCRVGTRARFPGLRERVTARTVVCEVARCSVHAGAGLWVRVWSVVGGGGGSGGGAQLAWSSQLHGEPHGEWETRVRLGGEQPGQGGGVHPHPLVVVDPDVVYAAVDGRWSCVRCHAQRPPGQMHHCQVMESERASRSTTVVLVEWGLTRPT
jgi:hypothetical protein